MENSTQGRRPAQIERNDKITFFSVIVLMVLMALLGSCSTTKKSLPYYDAKKYGTNPVKKNKPVRGQYAWIYRQWGHEGR